MTDPNQYSCHGFHADLPGGKATGVLRLEADGIHFTIGAISGYFPFAGTHMQLGGASDRLVLINHPQHPEWSIYTSERSILRNPHVQAHPQMAGHLARAKQHARKNWLIACLAFFLVVGVPAGLLWRSDIVTGWAAQQVPPEWETKAGRQALDQIRIKGEFMPQKESDALLAPLLAPLQEETRKSRFKWQFYIVNDPTPNAYALPGGFVVIHSGLILKADQAEEVLGVLGHEIAHVEQQHGVQNMIGNAGLYLGASLLFGDATGLVAVLANAAPLLLSQSYSRRFEEEADEVGSAMLVRARINPMGLVTFFEKIMAEEKKQLEKVEDEHAREALKLSMRFLSTHPSTEKRIADMKQRLSRQPAPAWREFGDAFPTLKQSVQTFVANSKQEKKGKT
ncbi:M48 family metallopeptidase [Massilia sp. W12]|uniref:M48 family metallopeptidase n=1 Tax=Massilia sp. W12 TaxID=3126507 RepID=UPI0030CC9C59